MKTIYEFLVNNHVKKSTNDLPIAMSVDEIEPDVFCKVYFSKTDYTMIGKVKGLGKGVNSSVENWCGCYWTIECKNNEFITHTGFVGFSLPSEKWDVKFLQLTEEDYAAINYVEHHKVHEGENITNKI